MIKHWEPFFRELTGSDIHLNCHKIRFRFEETLRKLVQIWRWVREGDLLIVERILSRVDQVPPQAIQQSRSQTLPTIGSIRPGKNDRL